MGHPLPPSKLAAALFAIRAWRADSAENSACPDCGAPGLDIQDRSARPYAEWYVLACGLDATINIPLGPPVAGAD